MFAWTSEGAFEADQTGLLCSHFGGSGVISNVLSEADRTQWDFYLTR